jgi:hypothetical protein
MRSFSWLVRWPLPPLTKTEPADLVRFLAAHPPLALGHRLNEDVHRLVKQRDPVAFDPWLHEAEASGLPPFQALAASVRQDLAAIQRALTTPWSTAQGEGQICRVKRIKRLGYGRAKPDLLRQRILHRAVASSRSGIPLRREEPLGHLTSPSYVSDSDGMHPDMRFLQSFSMMKGVSQSLITKSAGEPVLNRS